jgi:hypothetical protein
MVVVVGMLPLKIEMGLPEVAGLAAAVRMDHLVVVPVLMEMTAR